MDNLKSTPLESKHIALGAKMVPFAGWNMPVQYPEGILKEHLHTREHVSVFDICHMGEFRIKGQGAAAALDTLLARGVVDQKIGLCRYNFLMNEKGGVIDDLIVYRIEEEEFFIVVNAGTRSGDAERIKSNMPAGVMFSDDSDVIAKIDLQGPESADVLVKMGQKLEDLPNYFRWIKTDLIGIPCLLSRTGYTGELGFELYVPVDKAGELWDALLAFEGVKPSGLGARDTIRIEMGYPLYGHELNSETTPLEAGFGPMLKLDNDREFTGCGVLRNSPLKKRLIGVELEGRRAAREGAEVFFQGNKVGVVSSGVYAPSLEKAVALTFVPGDLELEFGTELELSAGRSQIKGKVVEVPFYKGGTARKKLVQ